ncbi:hypothetical protein [Sporosarcina sp. D27]|nr:hypothetical protein [Sporosarcina sp. D27]
MRNLFMIGIAVFLMSSCVPDEKDGNTDTRLGGDLMTTELLKAANQ